MKQIKCFLNEVYEISSQNKAQSALNVIDLSYGMLLPSCLERHCL